MAKTPKAPKAAKHKASPQATTDTNTDVEAAQSPSDTASSDEAAVTQTETPSQESTTMTEDQTQDQAVDNSAADTNEVIAKAKGKRGEIQYNTVTMDDGRVVEFAGKRKMLKTSLFDNDGSIKVRLDFVNGESRTFSLPETLLSKFAAHGAEQKLGDEIAGLEDVEDCILAVDELTERLNTGEWGIKREAAGIAGTSVLARALVQHSGKTPEVVKDFLSRKSHAEKVALRQNSALAPIIAVLEAAKNKKKSSVNTEALLEELGE